jgi:hypothetical protein
MRATEFIAETAEEDRAIISLANAIWEHIQQYKTVVRSGSVGTIDDITNTPLDAVKDIKVYLATDDDIAKIYNEDEPDASKHVTGDKIKGMWDQKRNTVYLNLTKITSSEVKRTIAHELRHVLDDVKSNNAAGSSPRYGEKSRNTSTDLDAYRSSKAEINARFIEVMHTIPIYVERAKQQNIPNPREFVMDKFYNMMDQRHIQKYFPEKERSREYKQLIKRAVNFIDKEIAHVFGTN